MEPYEIGCDVRERLYVLCFYRYIYFLFSNRYDHFDEREVVKIMDKLYYFITSIDAAIDTDRKRHIVGGILLSIALLFGGLSITIITIKEAYEEEEVVPYD